MGNNDNLIRIWWKLFDENDKEVGSGVYPKGYKYWGAADKTRQKNYGRWRGRMIGGERVTDKGYVVYLTAKNPWEEYSRTEICGICGQRFEAVETAEGFTVPAHLSIQGPGVRVGGFCAITKKKSVHRVCPTCFEKLWNFVEELQGVRHD